MEFKEVLDIFLLISIVSIFVCCSLYVVDNATETQFSMYLGVVSLIYLMTTRKKDGD
jgi:hypothetical protein